MNFRVGDFVTRISYKHDVVFKIIGFEGNTVFLKGINLRLIADKKINILSSELSNIVNQEYVINK